MGNRVLARLDAMGIQVKKTSMGNTLDNALCLTALFMGEYFTQLKDLLGRIKCALAYCGQFTLVLKGRTTEDISVNCQLANYLYKIAFLENYHLERYAQLAERLGLDAHHAFLP